MNRITEAEQVLCRFDQDENSQERSVHSRASHNEALNSRRGHRVVVELQNYLNAKEAKR
jgi:hypothetical protein